MSVATLAQSGPGGNGNEGVLHTPQISRTRDTRNRELEIQFSIELEIEN